jgi:hypothetical protein
MSLSIAEAEDVAKLPVFVVEGSNWTCEVEMDIDDADLSLEEQMVEAATKAIESCKGVREGSEVRITDDGLIPHWGLQLVVYPKGEDPEKSAKAVYTFITLANGGFYMDSAESLAILTMELKKLEEANKAKDAANNQASQDTQAKNEIIVAAQEKRKKKLAKEIKDFEQFQKDAKNGFKKKKKK